MWFPQFDKKLTPFGPGFMAYLENTIWRRVGHFSCNRMPEIINDNLCAELDFAIVSFGNVPTSHSLKPALIKVITLSFIFSSIYGYGFTKVRFLQYFRWMVAWLSQKKTSNPRIPKEFMPMGLISEHTWETYRSLSS